MKYHCLIYVQSKYLGKWSTDELSFYRIRSGGRAAYVMHILGYGRVATPPETARSLLTVVSEPQLMAWKPLRDRIK
jgi:hypothetical protein